MADHIQASVTKMFGAAAYSAPPISTSAWANIPLFGAESSYTELRLTSRGPISVSWGNVNTVDTATQLYAINYQILGCNDSSVPDSGCEIVDDGVIGPGLWAKIVLPYPTNWAIYRFQQQDTAAGNHGASTLFVRLVRND